MNLGDVWRPKAKIRLGLLDLLVYPLLHTNYEKSTGTSRCSPKNQVYDVVIFFFFMGNRLINLKLFSTF